MTRPHRTRIAAALPSCVLLLMIGCASDPDPVPGKDDPTVRVEKLLEEWRRVRDGGGTCVSGGRKYPYVDCDRIRAAIERLALDFPTHPEVLLVNAVIAFETHQVDKAGAYLDDLLAQEPPNPGVAVLRSRLSLRQGNLPYARRLLDEQISLTPDAADLREARASIYYLEGEYDRARRELTIAERLGAPSWRVAYNRGLLEEADGRAEEAIRHYRATIEQNPGFAPARSRLRGLESERGL